MNHNDLIQVLRYNDIKEHAHMISAKTLYFCSPPCHCHTHTHKGEDLVFTKATQRETIHLNPGKK